MGILELFFSTLAVSIGKAIFWLLILGGVGFTTIVVTKHIVGYLTEDVPSAIGKKGIGEKLSGEEEEE